MGAKDLRLLRAAAASRGTAMAFSDSLAEMFAAAKKAGLSGEDWAVGEYRMAQLRSGKSESASSNPQKNR